ALGVFDQVGLAGFGRRGGLGFGGSLQALADHLEAGVQGLDADLAVIAQVGVAQAGDDRLQAGAGRRVVVQLFTDLTADAVADTGFVGGKVELGHGRTPASQKRAARLTQPRAAKGVRTSALVTHPRQGIPAGRGGARQAAGRLRNGASCRPHISSLASACSSSSVSGTPPSSSWTCSRESSLSGWPCSSSRGISRAPIRASTR